MPSIFISYRREDSAGHAGRLAGALRQRFGRQNVFIDIDDIGPGEDFTQRIERALEACQVALVLIGPRWLAVGPGGRRRIDAPEDLFRQEVRAAVARPGVTVVPILVEGAAMPSSEQLPDDIAPITKLNAFELSNRHWDYDVAQLAGFAERYDRGWDRLQHRVPRLLLRASPLLALAIVGALVALLASGGGSPAKGGAQSVAAQVAACERTHGLTSAQETRQPEPGESQFKRSDVTVSGSELTFQQTTYASCSWPPSPGADPDGYLAITVTTTNGPGKDDGSGRDFADVIESHCDRLSLAFNEAMSGVQTPFQPFTAAPGDIWAPVIGSSSAPVRFEKVGQIGAPSEQSLRLPFYPQRSDVVVLTGQQELQNVSCLA